MQTVVQSEAAPRDHEASVPFELVEDPRWELVERIASTEAFRKSSKLPALLRYLAKCTIIGDRNGLTEQMIGRSVFGKSEDYTPAEDSSVRVYIRQLRLRLHEYYQDVNPSEQILISLPKGGYALVFGSGTHTLRDEQPVLAKTDGRSPAKLGFFHYVSMVLLALAIICACGWYFTAISSRSKTPWPLNQVMGEKLQTTLVLADAAYSLRKLGDQEIPLDEYVDRSFLRSVTPKTMTEGEAKLIHYLDVSRITSIADAHAAAVISTLASRYTQNLVLISARDFKANDLTHGNFIFVGAKTSNPWVELFDDRVNFMFMEDGPSGSRYILNRKPQPGEKTIYSVPNDTGASGEDYATITLLPAKNGSGNVLLIQGLRMEGTEALIDLLRNKDQLSKLAQKLLPTAGSQRPSYAEVLVHAQSVAGAPVSLDIVAVRSGI